MIVRITYRTTDDGRRVCPAPSCHLVRHVKDETAHLDWHNERVLMRLRAAGQRRRASWRIPFPGRWA